MVKSKDNLVIIIWMHHGMEIRILIGFKGIEMVCDFAANGMFIFDLKRKQKKCSVELITSLRENVEKQLYFASVILVYENTERWTPSV